MIQFIFLTSECIIPAESESKMKVAAVTLYPPKRAGSAFYAFNLYREIAKYCEVVILTDETASQTGTAKIIKGWSRNSFPLPFELFKHIYRARPSICHFQMEYRPFNDNAILSSLDALLTVILSRTASVKVMMTLHGIIYPAIIEDEKVQFFNRPLSKFLLTCFYKFLSIFSTKLIVHTQIMRKVLKDEYKIDIRKIVVIPHGVPRSNVLSRRLGKKIATIFFHGFIRPEKGLECLLKALRIVVDSNKNVRLVIAGGVPFQESVVGELYIDKLRKMINDLRLESHVDIKRGILSENELDKYISSSDVLVFPYLDRYLEASGAVARVMDYGVPIICARTPRFLGDLQNGQDCLMFDPNDEKELAKGIMNLINNQKLRQKISENLRDKAESRYWDVLAKEYIKLFKAETH